jgi:single-strand DNA-binding protein
MNHGTYPGRVGADAELRTLQSGAKLLSFRLANDVGFGDRKTTQWIDVSYFGKGAEAIAGYVRKGDKITVLGEVKLEEFQKRDGTPGAKLALNASHVELGDRKDRGDSQESGYSKGTPNAGYGGGGGRDYGTDTKGGHGGRGGGKPAFDQDLDDEIPFLSC